jgi:hypothetical protein
MMNTIQMKSHLIAIMAVIGIVLGYSNSVSASTTYTYSSTVDISSPSFFKYEGVTFNSYIYTNSINGAPSFTLLPGDTISGTISFLDSQEFLVSNQHAAQFASYFLSVSSNGQGNYVFDSMMNLLNVNRPPSSSNPFIASGVSGSGGIIAQFSFNFPADDNLSFTGFDYSITLSSSTGSSTFTPNAVYIQYMTPVPIPAAIWLFGSALAGLGVFAKGRKRVP